MKQANTNYDFIYHSPVGLLGGCIQDKKLSQISWLDESVNDDVLAQESCDDELISTIKLALDSYFESGYFDCEISLQVEGTPFQQRVWQALKNIPYGKVKTYGDVAKELKTSSRAVGQACGRNNIPLFIPCHRVVAANDLGGFMGGYRHVERKRWLLQHEGIL